MPRRKSKLETIEAEDVGKIEEVLDDIAATEIPEPEVSTDMPEVSSTDTNSEETLVVVEVTPTVNHDVILPRSASRYIPPLR